MPLDGLSIKLFWWIKPSKTCNGTNPPIRDIMSPYKKTTSIVLIICGIFFLSWTSFKFEIPTLFRVNNNMNSSTSLPKLVPSHSKSSTETRVSRSRNDTTPPTQLAELNAPNFKPILGTQDQEKKCLASTPSYFKSLSARTAIVLSGMYTHGYMKYTLESISRAFNVSDIEVFIYALYREDEDKTDIEKMLDSRPWIVSVLLERWSDDMYSHFLSDVITNNGNQRPYPPCCLPSCCSYGKWKCKEDRCNIDDPNNVAAVTLSLFRTWRLGIAVWERYVIKVRKGLPHRIMIHARADTIFPASDKDVDWGGTVANFMLTSIANVWVPWGGMDFTKPKRGIPLNEEEMKEASKNGDLPADAIMDKVIVGPSVKVAKIFKDIVLHTGNHTWRTDEVSERALWASINLVGGGGEKVRRENKRYYFPIFNSIHLHCH